MRTRYARQIRQGIVLFRLNWPRFSYRNAFALPHLTLRVWAELERTEEAKNG